MSDTFCVNPWLSVHSKLNQGYNPCCLYNKTYRKSIEEYVTSDELAETKSKLSSGIQVKECNICWQHEQQGLVSKRQRDNKTYQKLFQLNPDNFVEYYVRLGNHCNIRCTTCNETFSTGWLSENKKYGTSNGKAFILKEDHEIWQYMIDNSHTIAAIEFIGGEPFMMLIEKQGEFLYELIRKNDAKHIRLKYNTNGTKIPSSLVKLWGSFREVELNISMDGVGERFEYLRFPAVWNDFIANLAYYQSLPMSNLKITIMHTLSVMNLGYVQETIDFCKQQKVNLFLNLLEYPMHYNMFNFGPNVTNWLCDRIKDINDDTIKNVYNSLIVKEQFDTSFQKTVSVLDQRRGTNFNKCFPELLEMIRLDADNQ
jgi:MoaA/NifB/PqqE/SkfB family radical SAM enzyme